MVYTLGEAAKATSKSKATISKAIKSGRISAHKGENGAFSIEPSELHRVYPATVDFTQRKTPFTPKVNTPDNDLVRELQLRLEATQERLADKEAVISDLREDRDRWRQQATALLADHRPEPSSAHSPKGFFRRLLNK